MWHASVSPGLPVMLWDQATKRRVKRFARAALNGAGGTPKWAEFGETAWHLRKRVTRAELERIGAARDIRGTPEEVARLAVVRQEVSPTRWAQIQETV